MKDNKRQRIEEAMSKEPATQAERNPAQSERGLAATRTVSYARDLRAIGDDLESLHVEAFDLENKDNTYLVGGKKRPSSLENDTIKNVFKRGLRAAWQSLLGQPPGKPSSEIFEIRYRAEDIEQLDRKGHSRRKERQGISDTSRLSQVLRLVGTYLDLKGARLLAVSVRGQWIAVRYKTALGLSRAEEYRVASLYDFSVNMYLQRADRKSGRPRFAAAS